MTEKPKAEAEDFGQKTSLTCNQKKAFSVPNSSTEFESVKSVIQRLMKQGKIVRLYRCFACDHHFAALRMSAALVVCRECMKASRDKGRIAQRNRIDRIANKFRIFLRGRMEAK